MSRVVFTSRGEKPIERPVDGVVVPPTAGTHGARERASAVGGELALDTLGVLSIGASAEVAVLRASRALRASGSRLSERALRASARRALGVVRLGSGVPLGPAGFLLGGASAVGFAPLALLASLTGGSLGQLCGVAAGDARGAAARRTRGGVGVVPATVVVRIDVGRVSASTRVASRSGRAAVSRVVAAIRRVTAACATSRRRRASRRGRASSGARGDARRGRREAQTRQRVAHRGNVRHGDGASGYVSRRRYG